MEWVKTNRRGLIGALAVVLLGAGGVWFAISAKQRREAFATQSLMSARAAVQADNLPLAASDLSRLIQSYGKTKAGNEATILLAQVRLSQGDPQGAADGLRTALERGIAEQFEAAAHGLLGGALEELGEMREAAEEYLRAADASWYDFLAAQYLTDAGRTFAASGDTVRAASAYERLIQDHPESPAATEAQVRLAELRPTEPRVGT